jgi:translation initiation factor IF-3
LGIKALPEALNLARALDLDLVEVADQASPPVCKIMDYGKYKYEAAQRAKESRKKANQVVVKEMKYRPKISGGDFNTKTRKVYSFIEGGHKVKITIMFRGREVTHPQLGRKILDDIAAATEDIAKVETYPRLDGRNMTMLLGPDSKKIKKKKREEKLAAAEAAAESEIPEITEVPETPAEVPETPAEVSATPTDTPAEALVAEATEPTPPEE